jgi:transcription antitermination protein NusB
LQVLYLADLCRWPPEQIPSAAWSGPDLNPKTREFAMHLFRGTYEDVPRIDDFLKKYAQNWELPRMAAIDRCILRLASFELLHDLETPVNVIINEAVELAKLYSTAESGKFVNGILDKVKLERPASPSNP